MSSSNSSLLKDKENGSENSSSNGEVGGNNSDNSALVSLGNTSFGFNFDSEEGNQSPNTNSASNSEEGDSSDQGGAGDGQKKAASGSSNSAKAPSAGKNSSSKGGGSSKGSKKLTSGAISRQQKQLQQQDAAAAASSKVTTKATASSAGEAAARVTTTTASSTTSGRSRATSTTLSSLSSSPSSQSQRRSHNEAASDAVASLQSIAKTADKARNNSKEKQGLKRKSPDSASGTADNDSNGGYNSDDEAKPSASSNAGAAAAAAGAVAKLQAAHRHVQQQEDGDAMMQLSQSQEDNAPDAAVSGGKGGGGSRKKKAKLDDMKREERNAREKERSFRISKQINELRDLLSTGGVIVPKGTKSSVLTEAANYIRMLQQHQYRSEMYVFLWMACLFFAFCFSFHHFSHSFSLLCSDRHQLVQQIQMIGGGALGQPAATAVRHVAAQNGVWSLGNFGGVPPKSAMMYHQSGSSEGGEATPSETQEQEQQPEGTAVLPSKIEEGDYRHIFNSCTVGMAIASMGGAFIDCNKLFCQLSAFSKQEVCSMTVFNLTSRQDLQPAFDLISQMLSAPADPNTASTSCVLRGSFKHNTNLGLDVSLIKGEDGVAKCFCVTLILNPASPFDTSRPVPATIELVGLPQGISVPNSSTTKQASQTGLDPSPAYTAG
ncbi:MAG: hypothetical protein SGILL_003427 [Bacillariaceae sp.]